jgi:pimeloyl-ACP methyl ester carboxylesterase
MCPVIASIPASRYAVMIMRSLHALTLLLVFMSAAFSFAAPLDKQSASFDSNSVKIAYVVAGHGPPVILIHGLYSSEAINWELPGTFAMLAAHYRVIAPDLRGHGRSDKPQDQAAYGQPFVDDIIRLMDHLNIPKAHVVGYSLGGIIVMKLLVDHPDRVSSAALGGMGWLRPGSWQQTFFERTSGQRGPTPPACVHGIANLAVTQDQVQSITTPMCVLVGQNDPCRRIFVLPLERIRPDIPVTLIPDAGHLTCIAKPLFKQQLLKWIDEQPK